MRERNDATGIPRGLDTPLGVSRSSGTISPYAAGMTLKDPTRDPSRRCFETYTCILNPNLRACSDFYLWQRRREKKSVQVLKNIIIGSDL